MPDSRATDALPPTEAPRPRQNRVGKFGERLRREREMRGIPLEEIAEATKIGTRSLRALEDERFEQLPGGIFNKGFVRAYARFLGIDEDQAVADYISAMEAQDKTTDPAHLEEIARQVQAQREQMSRSQNTIITWVAVILIFGVVALGAYGWRSWQKDKADRQTAAEQELERQRAATLAQQQLMQQQASPAATSLSAAPTQTLPDAQNPAEQSQKDAGTPKQESSAAPKSGASSPSQIADSVELTLSAVARTWISVTVDGGKPVTMTLDPKDPELQSKTFHGNEKVYLIVGNPAGLQATMNGKPVGPLGPEGQRRSVMFTPSGKQ